MTRQLEAAHLLLTKARNDLRAAEIILNGDGPIDAVSFHLQQCAEKCLKAYLTSLNVKYPFTHDLAELLETAMPHHAELAEFESTLPSLSEYAVGARYDDAFLPSIPKLHEDFTVVRAIFGTIERLLSTARPL